MSLRALFSSVLAVVAALGVLACGASSPYFGADLIYARVMTDSEGKQTPVRAYFLRDANAFERNYVDPDVNYAAAKLDFIHPTYMIVFNALPGGSISHTRDLSKAAPLLGRELCKTASVGQITKEMDWNTGERKVYVECEGLTARYDLNEDGELTSTRASTIDDSYILNYRVIMDTNGDEPGSVIAMHPDGRRERL